MRVRYNFPIRLDKKKKHTTQNTTLSSRSGVEGWIYYYREMKIYTAMI